MFNPRFPHTLRVWRTRKDEYGEPMVDDEGEPIIDIVPLKKVVTIDGLPGIGIDGTYDFDMVEWIEFGYRTQGKNTKETLDVHIADFKLATPMFTTPLEDGDRVEIQDYDRSFWGEVVKKFTTNLGSNIYINEVKN